MKQLSIQDAFSNKIETTLSMITKVTGVKTVDSQTDVHAIEIEIMVTSVNSADSWKEIDLEDLDFGIHCALYGHHWKSTSSCIPN